jgi:hypothetical protein
MMVMLRVSMGYLVFLVGLVAVALLFLKGVRADASGLLVQNVEINPAVAEIGEHVSVKMTIRNTQRNDTCCNVTLCCGDCVVGTKKINIARQSSVPISFKLNTSLMSTGVYSIELIVEDPSGQQKIFDLGSIPIEEEDATAPDVTEPEPNDVVDLEPKSATYFNWQFLLPIAPVGAAATILVMRKQRNKNQEPVVPKAELPHMLNEILKFEEEVEAGISNENKKYIC